MGRYSRSAWTNIFFSFAVPVIVGAAVICASSVIFSVVAFFVFRSTMFSDIFTIMSLITGGVVGGFICGKYRRRRGLVDGTICGLLLYTMILLVSLLFGGFTDIKKLLLLVAAGAVGGVSGVNSKRPKNLM